MPLSSALLTEIDEASGAWNFPRCFASYSAPGTSHDETLGFWFGSFWLDAAGNTLYVCSDPTTSNAVWRTVTTW